MDPLEFGSLARIRVLLLPVGAIKRAAFEQWAAEIRSFQSIRLGDIPADTREDKGAQHRSHAPHSRINCLVTSTLHA